MPTSATPSALPGLPAWATVDAVAETHAVFGGLYGRQLSDAEVAEILVNADQLFRLLSGSSPPAPSPAPASAGKPNARLPRVDEAGEIPDTNASKGGSAA